MKLYKCGVCGTELPTLSNKCPKCGKYRFVNRVPTKAGWIFALAIMLVVLISYIIDKVL